MLNSVSYVGLKCVDARGDVGVPCVAHGCSNFGAGVPAFVAVELEDTQGAFDADDVAEPPKEGWGNGLSVHMSKRV